MGSGPSSVRFSSLSNLNTTNDTFFEVAYDNSLTPAEFICDLIKLTPEQVEKAINLPCDSLVGCLMSDPEIYTQVNTPAEVWLDLLVPLFNGNSNSAPYFQHILVEYFKFLNERSNGAIKNEQSKRNLEQETISQELRNTSRIFMIQKNNKKAPTLNEISEIKTSKDLIKLFGSKTIDFVPVKDNIHGNNFILDIISKTNDPQDLYNSVLWSLNCGDVTSMIGSLNRAFDLITSKQSIKTSNISFKFPSLTNSLFIPDQQSLNGWYLIEKMKISSHITNSVITCDGSCVYVLGNHSTIHQILLSSAISNPKSRFSAKDIKTSKKERLGLGITGSNGRLIVTGQYLKSYGILLKTSPMSEVKKCSKATINTFSKLQQPLTSDGYFIYSLAGQKVNVFSMHEDELVFNRTIKLVSSKAVCMEQFSKKLIPDLSNAMLVTNGVTLTIIKPSSKQAEIEGRFNYIARHFSLFDGSHINDVDFYTKIPLISVCFDPWNKCYWGLGAKGREGLILNFKMQGSQPMWVTGVDPNAIIEDSNLSKCFSMKNTKKVIKGIIDFINYYMSYYTGSKFNPSSRLTADSTCSGPRFFAPGTQKTVDLIFEVITKIVDIIKRKSFNKMKEEKCTRALQTLIYLLDFNLANYQIYQRENKLHGMKKIVELYLSIYNNPVFKFLNHQIAFSFINSFDVYLTEKTEANSKLFSKIIETIDENMYIYATTITTKSYSFPYCFTPVSCRKIFSPILKNMSKLSSDINRHHFEIVYAFLRLTIYELYQAFEESTGELPPRYRIIQDNLQTFSGLITEGMIRLIDNTETDQSSFEKMQMLPFSRIFQKWMFLLHPFVKFSRMSGSIVSILQPLFTSLSYKIKQLNLKNQFNNKKSSFSFTFALFYNLFSLYVNFISAIMDGGEELKDFQQYTWIATSTLQSGFDAKKIDDLTEKYQSEKKYKYLIKRGLSYNTVDDNEYDKNQLEEFINNLIAQQELPAIKKTMDYIYKKVNDPYNKRLSEDDRRLERLVLAVLFKHLGLVPLARELTIKISKDQKPLLNNYIRQCISAVYKLRRQLKHAKQIYNQNIDKDIDPNQEVSLNDDYPAFLAEVTKKSVFMLHIPPCSRSKNEEKTDIYSTLIKKITNFIGGSVTISSFFDIIKNAQTIQANVATGLGLVNNVLEENNSAICTSFLVQKFATSNSISAYLSSLSDTPDSKAVDSPALLSVIKLMNFVRELIISNSSEYQKNTLLVFFTNLIYSISSIAPEMIVDPLTELVKQIILQKDSYSPEVFSSYISFIISSIIVIIEKNPSIKKTDVYEKLYNNLSVLIEYGHTHQSIGMLIFKAGFTDPPSPHDVFKSLSSADPIQFQPICLYIYELISTIEDKSLILFPIFKEIATIAHGGRSSILNSRPTIMEKGNSDTVVTPNIILAGATACIQLIRKLLQKGDRSTNNIITYILKYNSGEDVDGAELSCYNDKNMLFAVFAILSNVIDNLHFGSVLKSNTSNEMYFINGFDTASQKLKCWPLPIKSDSQEKYISLTNEYEIISLIPFTTTMYTDYGSLIPYFRKYMEKSHDYTNEAISFYVLSSLQEYVLVPDVQKQLSNIFGNIGIDKNRLAFTDSTHGFMKLLTSHLYDTSNGFTEPNPYNIKFNLASLTTIPPENYKITHRTITTQEENYYTFLTQPLSGNKDYYLTVSVDKGRKPIFVSIIEPSLSFFNYKKFEHIVTAQSEPLTFCYKPHTKDCLIILSKTGKVIFNGKTGQNAPVFCIEAEGNTEINYNIRENNETYREEVNEPEKLSFDYHTLTYTRHQCNNDEKDHKNNLRITFRKKRKIPIEIDDENPCNTKLVFEQRIESKRNQDIDISRFKVISSFLEDEKIKVNEESCDEPLLVLPDNEMAIINKGLDININNIHTPTTVRPTYEISAISKVKKRVLSKDLILDCNTSMGRYTFTRDSSLLVNSLTGQFDVSIRRESARHSIPNINVSDFNYLPTPISNYLMTNITERKRKEVISKAYIKSLSMATSPAAFESVITAFNTNNTKVLCQQMISLLTLSEPFIGHELIDLETNMLNTKESISPEIQEFHSAAESIYQYFESDEKLAAEFTTAYFSVINDMMHNKKWHFALEGNPNILYLDGKEQIEITDADIQYWIIVDVNGGTYEINNVLNITNNRNPIICIPVKDRQNVLGTFVELAIAFKYFVYIIKANKSQYRSEAYGFFIHSYIYKSPFFYNNEKNILEFLLRNIPTSGSDIKGDFLSGLNILISRRILNPPEITMFIEDCHHLWCERILLPLKMHFPEFMTPADMEEAKEIKKEKIKLQPSPIPNILEEKETLIKNLLSIVKRTLLNRDTIVGYPFHFIITTWTEFSIRFPAVTQTFRGKTLVIEFNTYVPKIIKLLTKDNSSFDVEVLKDPNDATGTKCSSSGIKTNNQNKIYLKTDESWANYQFIVEATTKDIDIDNFIEKYRERFVTAITSLSVNWNRNNDQKILYILGASSYSVPKPDLNISPTTFINCGISEDIPVILIRARLLIILNWLVSISSISMENDPCFATLIESIAAPLKIAKFQDMVRRHGSESSRNMTIDRKRAFDVREGLSKDYNYTIINQVSREYAGHPNSFRNNSDRPWHVEFKNEAGIDAGGPARELVVECAKDLNSPNCGLVIPVPNATNEVGSNREYFIPVPMAGLMNVERQYVFAGAFIGICIRSGLVQELNFPPLVWDYLVTKKINIDNIFEIDENYKHLIKSLLDAITSGISEEEFSTQFNQKFVVFNSAGVECPLIANGRQKSVTLSNVREFISKANEFRIKEIQPYLQMMYTGLWENLNFKPPTSIDGSTLEFSACGEKEITAEAFMAITTFKDTIKSHERTWFANIIKRFTPEERTMLLKFATGRVRLPPQHSSNHFTLIIDRSDSIDKLPLSSTCFHQLHLPSYTSEEKMYTLVRAAACFTGSFEMS